MNILMVDGLCKQYPTFRLQDVSFSMQPGTIMGFIGRNGAGKTTTLKSILHLVHPDGGKIEIFGMDMDTHEREIREKIGFVSGGIFCYPRKRLQILSAVADSIPAGTTRATGSFSRASRSTSTNVYASCPRV